MDTYLLFHNHLGFLDKEDGVTMKGEGLDSEHSKQETLLAANGQHVAEVQLQNWRS